MNRTAILRNAAIVTAGAALVVTGWSANLAMGTGPANADGHHVLPCSAYATGSPSGGVDGACTLDVTVNGAPTLDTASYGTDIPRCATDDSNTTGLPVCYTERTTDNAVIIVDQDDETLATLTAN